MTKLSEFFTAQSLKRCFSSKCPLLPEGFAEDDGGGDRDVQGPHFRGERDTHPGVGGLMDVSRHAPAFPAQKQGIAGQECEIGIGDRAGCG